jgi:signal transduction histidine kinase
MRVSKSTWVILVAWIAFVGGFAFISVAMPPGQMRASASNIVLCLVPLFANACLLWNASSPYRRQNNFWMLLAFGCTLWLAGQLMWTYKVMVLHRGSNAITFVDVTFFLHAVPFIAALAMLPHARKMREVLRYGHLDMLLLSISWLFIYLFMVMAWSRDPARLALEYTRDIQVNVSANLVFSVGTGFLALRANKGWRIIYANLFGASAMYFVSLTFAAFALFKGNSAPQGLLNLPLVAAFVWLGTAGIIARRISPTPDLSQDIKLHDSRWFGRVAVLSVLCLPFLAAWSSFDSGAPLPVRRFRLLLTLCTIIIASAILFLRHQLVDRDRNTLLKSLQDSVENLKRLQMQFVQAEKLASLGQLAAGAAHEINNPLTAILGYADLIQADPTATDRSRNLSEKIRDQARRTKVLVTNLLSFARQVPAEKQLLDLRSVVTSAIELRQLDLRDKKIRIEVENPGVLPAVRGDPNQLLQVFFNLINNSVDAMETVGGGTLTVRMRSERGSVILDFSDSGPGLREPDRVFDPFYTTKPVGKGTGLGLSICYGIVQEHGGQIFGFNRTEGGCTFRVILPAVLALYPQLANTAPPVGSRQS